MLDGNLFEKNFIQFLKNYSKETLFTELQKLLNNSKDLESTISSNKIDVEIEKSNKAIKQILNKLKLTDDDELSKIIYKSDKLSRNCFNCKSYNDCYWDENKKNKIIIL